MVWEGFGRFVSENISIPAERDVRLLLLLLLSVKRKRRSRVADDDARGYETSFPTLPHHTYITQKLVLCGELSSVRLAKEEPLLLLLLLYRHRRGWVFCG